MATGVVYLCVGTKHGPRLATSLFSLRKHYHGPVTVISADEESAELVTIITGDPRLAAKHIHVKHRVPPGPHLANVLKAHIQHYSPYHTTAFLDCDTVVVGDIAPLFDLQSPEQILVTSFAHWTTGQRMIQRRIRSWAHTHAHLVTDALIGQLAVNTGIYAFTRHTAILDEWSRVTLEGRSHFIPDEVAMQLLLPRYPHVFVDQRFNFSVKCAKVDLPDKRIVHFHGRCHTGSHGSLWMATYAEVLEVNIAGIRDWTPGGDPQLRRHLRSKRKLRR